MLKHCVLGIVHLVNLSYLCTRLICINYKGKLSYGTIKNVSPCGDKFLKVCVPREKWVPLRQNHKLCCSVNSNIVFLQKTVV